MKEEAPKEPAFEVRDPELPVIHGSVPGSRGESHRRN